MAALRKPYLYETLDQFYIDFHTREVIDERLNKICKKIQDHLNLHSCITRVVLKMIAEHFNGTILIPFLNEFNKIPRFISIIDIFDDLITSVIREDDLIEYLTKHAMTIKVIYTNSPLNNDERQNFITKNFIESTKRLSSLCIHVKTLIETKTFVNE
ncbi:unnamed protein product [Rotaria sp. Silwood1]|nr:unnamed protein product [Rotaria sp. Silwood1]CAF1692342.1 unnamed protein product [Rotaria sp. Silwood1]